MIPVLETTGFFLAIAAALQFSTWAEGWLASGLKVVKARAPDAPLSVAAGETSGKGSARDPFGEA